MIPSKVERAIQEAYTQLESEKADRKSSTSAIPKRRFRTAAAIAIAALAIGTTAYAATRQSALLDYFSRYDDGRALPEQAKSLIETEVTQEKADGGIVSFSIQEALCDKNTIIVAVEAKAAEPDKYLLVPYYYGIQDGENAEKMNMANLNPSMPEKKMKIADYARKYNKEILPIDVDINTGANTTSSAFTLKEDGTAVFTCKSENISKEAVMNLSYRTGVFYDGEFVMNTFDFTVNDNSEESETAIYRTEGNEPVSGTNVVIDELKFVKSEIDITSTLTYHYVDNPEKMIAGSSTDIKFLFFGPDGKKLKNGPGMGGEFGPEGDGVFTQAESLALIDLPEQITLQGEDFATREKLGSIKVYRVD